MARCRRPEEKTYSCNITRFSMLATQRFDVVISDFNIPGASGLELINKIRQDYHETILILTTAYGTKALEEEVHRLGFGYITKPLGPSLLVQFIHDWIRDGTENAPRILIPDPKGKTGMP